MQEQIRKFHSILDLCGFVVWDHLTLIGFGNDPEVYDLAAKISSHVLVQGFLQKNILTSEHRTGWISKRCCAFDGTFHCTVALSS